MIDKRRASAAALLAAGALAAMIAARSHPPPESSVAPGVQASAMPQAAPPGTAERRASESSSTAAASPGRTPSAQREQRRRPLEAALQQAQAVRLRERVKSASAAARDGTPHLAALADPARPGELGADYVRERIEEIVPLVRGCYERALERLPSLQGRAVIEFALIGEAEVGALVESSELVADASTLDDPEFSECLSETMYALELGAPPVGGGRIVVRYPFEFHTRGASGR